MFISLSALHGRCQQVFEFWHCQSTMNLDWLKSIDGNTCMSKYHKVFYAAKTLLWVLCCMPGVEVHRRQPHLAIEDIEEWHVTPPTQVCAYHQGTVPIEHWAIQFKFSVTWGCVSSKTLDQRCANVIQMFCVCCIQNRLDVIEHFIIINVIYFKVQVIEKWWLWR